MKNILVTGGGGYVGSVLTDNLINLNYNVTVLDLFIYGKKVFKNFEKINLIQGDIRDKNLLKKITKNKDTIIHLACISNDPSFDLNPQLGKSVNLDSFEPMVKICKDSGIKNFIYASTSSVYGVKKELDVTEKMKLEPLTDYSKYKAICEDICLKHQSRNFKTVILRPATVCGFSIRQRFDLVVNILTNLGYNEKLIKVFGGNQLRPNIHIEDMVNAYITVLNKINSIDNSDNVFNVGYENYTIIELANIVKKNLDNNVLIKIEKTFDNRSYKINSEKFYKKFNFKYSKTINDAVNDLIAAFRLKKFNNPLKNKYYFNIKMMKSLNLK